MGCKSPSLGPASRAGIIKKVIYARMDETRTHEFTLTEEALDSFPNIFPVAQEARATEIGKTVMLTDAEAEIVGLIPKKEASDEGSTTSSGPEKPSDAVDAGAVVAPAASISQAGNAPAVLPTMGRIVLFKPTADLTFPAMITAVSEDSKTVNLCVFAKKSTVFENDIEQGEGEGQWDWMPFQKDQQARLAK